MTSTLNICYVSQEYPEETSWGGIGTYTYEMAHELAHAGHRVVVLSRALARPQRYVEEDGVEVYRILPRFSLGRVPFFWRLNRLWEGYRLAVAEALHHIVRQHHIDLIEAPDLHAEPLVFRMTKIRRPPLVIRLHSANRAVGQPRPVTSSSLRKHLNDLAERLTLRLAAAITSPSYAVARNRDPAFRLPSGSYVVIPNPVNTSLFRPIHNSGPDANAEVLYLGRFAPLKGLDVLLEAVPQICEAVPEARVTLIGAGMDKSNATEAGGTPDSWLPTQFADRVRVMPYVPRSQLPAVYARAAICVVPSRWEPFGYTCAEAMACGKAVVASRAGGLAEMIEDQVSGLLVEPGDSLALAEAIVQLLRDAGLREEMGRAARQRAEEMFSSRVVVPKMVKLYRGLVANS